MKLKEIYKPIKRELGCVERTLKSVLGKSRNDIILKTASYIMCSAGKRIRPALVILSAKASGESEIQASELIKIAAASEFIHTASLVHDDVIDNAFLRYNKPTVNSKYGHNLSIALGDYLYSVGFKLISSCGNTDILSCFSDATCLMCEGELTQVSERKNLELLKKRYMMIIKKKTASLFIASCQAGAILSTPRKDIHNALVQYGLNFGMAFQIADDCLDVIGEKEDLGKTPGTDLKMGELTLPLINLLDYAGDKKGIISLIQQNNGRDTFERLRKTFLGSPAFTKTREDIYLYLKKARGCLKNLNESYFKCVLFGLTDYVMERINKVAK